VSPLDQFDKHPNDKKKGSSTKWLSDGSIQGETNKDTDLPVSLTIHSDFNF
jgi:hypothetical protein